MDPATLIRLARVRRGLTQRELAANAGTSQPVVSAYEHGRREPSVETLRRLIAATGEQLQLGLAVVAPDLPPPTSPAEHARRLVELLHLVDAIPTRRRAEQLDAPRLVSRRWTG